MSERRRNILACAEDLAVDFLYYDRKEDESLPRGEIEAALRAGEVTVDEILAPLRKTLEEARDEKAPA